MPIELPGTDLQVEEALISSDPGPAAEVVNYRLQAARRQSRMTQFISNVKEGENYTHEPTDFEQAMMKIQKKKKKKAATKVDDTAHWGKLTLVWKERDTFIISKTPQTCLQELMTQKMAPKKPTTQRRQCKQQRGPNISGQVDERRPEKKSRIIRLKTDSEISKRQAMDERKMHPKNPLPSITAITTAATTDRWSISEHSSIQEAHYLENCMPSTTQTIISEGQGSLLPRIDEKVSYYGSASLSISHSIPPSTTRGTDKPYHRERRFSRNLFSTKKDTGNEEGYMYANTCLAGSKLNVTKTESDKDAFHLNKRKSRKIRKNEELVPELKTKIAPEALVKAFISEQFLDMYLQGPNSEQIRKMYNFTITQQRTLSGLIVKHPEMLPARIFKDLITYKKKYEVTPLYLSTRFSIGKQQWRDYFIESLSPKGRNMLEELESEIPLYSNFYKNLIKERAASISVCSQLVREKRKTALRDIIAHITHRLRASRQAPGSPVRLETMAIMATAGYNNVLLAMLAQSVDSWLDQLAKCLGSTYKSIREETCQILCYMTMCYPLMRALYISKYFDVVHDLVNVLFKSIETYEDTFDDYYITIVHLMHYTPSRGALDCIFDRLHLFKCVEMMRRWPRLTYYAFKYWPDDPLGVKSPLYGKRIVRTLETAMQKPLTQKFARAALYQFHKRYNNVSHIFTAFSDKAQKAYMVALGLDQ